jgi:ribosomal 30S subunit maturation factor RimM
VTAGADAPEEHVLLGEVHGVFGVRGWLKVRSFTRPTSGLFEYPRLSFGRDSPEFDFNDDAIPTGVELMCELALNS